MLKLTNSNQLRIRVREGRHLNVINRNDAILNRQLSTELSMIVRIFLEFSSIVSRTEPNLIKAQAEN